MLMFIKFLGFIVRKLNLVLKCEGCLEAVEAVNLNDGPDGKGLLAVKDRGGLIIPAKDVTSISEICEKIFQELERKKQISMSTENHFLSILLKDCIGKNFFPQSHFLDEEIHYSSLIKSIGKLYFKTRIYHYVKKNNDSVQKIRFFSNKLVLFKGQ